MLFILASKIEWTLVSILILLYLGYNLNFHDSILILYLEAIYFGVGFILDGFLVLEIDSYMFFNIANHSNLLMTTSRNIIDSVIV